MMFSTEMLVLVRVLVHFQQCNPTMQSNNDRVKRRVASADMGYLGFASKISADKFNATAAADADASNGGV